MEEDQMVRRSHLGEDRPFPPKLFIYHSSGIVQILRKMNYDGEETYLPPIPVICHSNRTIKLYEILPSFYFIPYGTLGNTRIVLQMHSTHGVNEFTFAPPVQIPRFPNAQIRELDEYSGLPVVQREDHPNAQIRELEEYSGLPVVQREEHPNAQIRERDEYSGLPIVQREDHPNVQMPIVPRREGDYTLASPVQREWQPNEQMPIVPHRLGEYSLAPPVQGEWEPNEQMPIVPHRLGEYTFAPPVQGEWQPNEQMPIDPHMGEYTFAPPVQEEWQPNEQMPIDPHMGEYTFAPPVQGEWQPNEQMPIDPHMGEYTFAPPVQGEWQPNEQMPIDPHMGEYTFAPPVQGEWQPNEQMPIVPYMGEYTFAPPVQGEWQPNEQMGEYTFAQPVQREWQPNVPILPEDVPEVLNEEALFPSFLSMWYPNDKTIDEIANENQTTIMDTNVPKERKETWAVPQAASVSYKPTPIAELKKRHLPVNTAPTANSSIKRRMEYNVRKPKIEYMPEVPSYDSYSGVENNAVQQVYKATRISERNSNKSDVFITDILQGSPADDANDESGDDDIDLEQVSTELNFLDQFLKEYESEDGTNTNINHQLNNNRAPATEDTNTGKFNRETVNEITKLNNNTTNKENKSTPQITGKISSEKQNFIDDSRNRENKITIPKHDISDNEPIKTKKTDHCNESSSKVSSHSRSDKKSDDKKSDDKKSSDKKSEHKKDPHHPIRQESDKHKKSEDSSTRKSESKKQEKENDISSCKSNLNESEKSKEKLESKDKSSSTRRKSTSSKSSKSESENKNVSHKSSKRDKEHRSSSKSKSKEDHGDSVSKSSSKPKLDDKKTNESSSRHSKKDESKTKPKPIESKKRDEDKHKKEKHDKNKEKYRQEKRKRESEECEKTDSEQLSKKSRLSKPSDDCNEVEIISDSEPIIIIDSDDDSNKDKRRKRKISNRSERVSSSPEFNRSPVLPSDSESNSGASLLETDMEVEQLSKSAPIQSKQDDILLVDHRVMSRMKNRVSLGNTWRPPTRKRVEPVTPAQRLQLFRKQLQEQDEKEEQSPTAPRVRIGCGINVKGLLEEKQRLLQMNNGQKRTGVSGNSTARPVSGIIRPAPQSTAHTSTATPEDKDEPPKVEYKPHPEKAGADLATRQRYMDLLYKAARQLVKPGRLYASAREKCIKAEEMAYLKTKHTTYCARMKGLIESTSKYIPEFSLNYFLKLKPREDKLFPPELKKTDENGVGIRISLYEALHRYLLTEEELEREGYPRWKKDPEHSGLAYINAESIARWKDRTPNIPPRGEKACSKCNKFYTADERGLSLDSAGCSYHSKSGGYSNRSHGEKFKKFRCCNRTREAPCMFSTYHSTETADFQNLEGFVETPELMTPEPYGGWGVFAVDCEMVWTTHGIELGRVTVVNAEERVVFDTCVRLEHLVTDYVTSLSGLTESILANAPLTFAEVQQKLLKLFNSKSILIGHSLENDLKVLKIIHNKVVDTSLIFKEGEYKKSLKNLASGLLGKVIQSEDAGHSSEEDATACLQLMIKKVERDFAHIKKPNPPVMRYRSTSRSSALMSP